jgi:hypothetical protein
MDSQQMKKKRRRIYEEEESSFPFYYNSHVIMHALVPEMKKRTLCSAPKTKSFFTLESSFLKSSRRRQPGTWTEQSRHCPG